MIANIPVRYAHHGISGLSFLHRGKRLSLLILRKCWVMSDYFLLFNLFQLDLSCAAHMQFPSLSSSFSSSYLYNAPARQEDILQTAKKCYSLHSLIPFSSPSILSTCESKHTKMSTLSIPLTQNHFKETLTDTHMHVQAASRRRKYVIALLE